MQAPLLPVALHGLVVEDPVEVFEPAETSWADAAEATEPARQFLATPSSILLFSQQ